MTQAGTAPPTTPPNRSQKGRRRFVIDADWQFYRRMLRAFESSPGHRLAYDRGRLEIMSPGILHDESSWLLGSMVAILTEERGIPLKRGGSVALRVPKRRKGIEADAAFWLANADKLAGVTELDLNIHPPPDLAIEVDVSRSSLNRFAIYAAIRVPELWRLHGDDLRFHVLGESHTYHEAVESLAFKGVKPSDLLGYLRDARNAGDETPVLRRFREWVRTTTPAAG